MALGLLGRDEGRAQPARSAGIGDACTPVRRAFTAALCLVALSRRRREEDRRGGTEQCACCCSVELIYTTRFDTSVITHRGLIRCSSGSEGTSGRQRAGQGKGKGRQSGRQEREDRHVHRPKTLQRDTKDRKQNKQTNNNKERCCVSV